jgi:hypothetical protein
MNGLFFKFPTHRQAQRQRVAIRNLLWEIDMKMTFSTPRVLLLSALTLGLAISGSAFAQSTASSAGTDKMGSMPASSGAVKGMDKMDGMSSMHKKMMGMHMMPATVTTADTKTGVVDVMTEGMALKVHFPPKAMASLKAGDKIVLHMGFSKP